MNAPAKACSVCKIEKPLSDFYMDRQKSDGLAYVCKQCDSARQKASRKTNKQSLYEYEQARYMSPQRVKYRAEYQSGKGREMSLESKAKWLTNNPIKRKASVLINRLIKSGRIQRPYNCSECGEKTARIHGHHDDYAVPLVVRWLCQPCHFAWHKENGAGLNG